MIKVEIVCNKHFSPFLKMFSTTYMVFTFHFKSTLKCRLQFVSIWTGLKFCRLVIGLLLILGNA